MGELAGGGNELAQEGKRIGASPVKSRITEGEDRAAGSTETSRLAPQRRKCRELARSRTLTRDTGTKRGRILRISKKVRRVRAERNGEFVRNGKKGCGEKEKGRMGDAKD